MPPEIQLITTLHDVEASADREADGVDRKCKLTDPGMTKDE